MESFTLYLLKSVTWLTGFALIFILFLRNERFFVLNRVYLISGILASFLFPFISVHYAVILPVVRSFSTDDPVIGAVRNASNSKALTEMLLLGFYLSGMLFVLILLIRKTIPVLRSIRKAGIISLSPVKIIKSNDYTSSFSFFSYVFVNPSITDVEIREIVNHEQVHIRQKHWLDLLLMELFCIFQWFNPLAWIFARFIRQNHEYLADEEALQQTTDPAVYRATLLNQIAGTPVISLANSFNYSANKKRFIMMKNITSSPYRKLRLLLILPVFAIVLFTFAKPDYKYSYTDGSSLKNDPVSGIQTKEVKGTIVQQDGNPLPGAMIMLKGTIEGTMADSKGSFKLSGVTDDGILIVTFVGFKSKVIKPHFDSEMTIQMIQDTLKYVNSKVETPPPPPPTRKFEKPPLVIVDGKISEVDLNKIDPETIFSVNVLKDKPALDKYGEKGNNGAIEITTKKYDSNLKSEKEKKDIEESGKADNAKEDGGMVVVTEELPEFPGGREAMGKWIYANLKYPGDAVKGRITGTVHIVFLISSTGKIKNVEVSVPVYPSLDAEAKRVIGSMPDWKPGSQAGKTVSVRMIVPVEFKLQ